MVCSNAIVHVNYKLNDVYSMKEYYNFNHVNANPLVIVNIRDISERLEIFIWFTILCHYFSLNFVTRNVNSDFPIINTMIFIYIIIILFNNIQ